MSSASNGAATPSSKWLTSPRPKPTRTEAVTSLLGVRLRPVAAFISIGSIPFLATDGNTYNGFGGIRGQGTGGDRNLVPVITRNSIKGQPNHKLDLRVARDIRVTERVR